MGLFDDLLKKPKAEPQQGSSGTSGTNSPVTDPLAAAMPPADIKIEKSGESSIATEAPVLAQTPPPVTTSAADGSSILVSSDSSDSTPIAPETEESSIITIDVPPAPTTSPVIDESTLDLSALLGKTEEAPQAQNTETPVAPIEQEAATPDLSAILGNTPETIAPPVANEAPVTSLVSDTPIMSEEAQSNPEAIVETSSETSPLFDMSEEVSSSKTYEHPSDFIDASIEKIDAMIEKIDEAHSAKLEEALGYKTEKEKYTDLEETAYTDAENLVEEKNHALSMRTYFEGQKGTPTESMVEETPTPSLVSEPEASIAERSILPQEEGRVEAPETAQTSSVETTLTGLSVASAVNETVVPEASESPTAPTAPAQAPLNTSEGEGLIIS